MSHPFSRTIIIVQARSASKRLPRKVFRKVYGYALLEHLLLRLYHAHLPIILAVPSQELKCFAPLVKKIHRHWKKKYQIENHHANQKSNILNSPPLILEGGSDVDVLSRYHQAITRFSVKYHPVETIVRVTADNPFTSVFCLLDLLPRHLKNQADVSYYEGLPYGAGVEIIQCAALNIAHTKAYQERQREHLTQYFYANRKDFSIYHPEAPKCYAYPELRVTVDTIADFKSFKKRITSHLSKTELQREKKVVPLLKIIATKKINFLE